LNEFKDNQINPSNSSVCYQVFYSDSCGNVSPVSLPSCSILLKGELVAKDQNKLQWNEYREFKNGIKQYYIQYLNEEGDVLEEIPVGLSTDYDDRKKNESQVVRYRIKVESNDPMPIVSFSNIVPIKQNFLILLPNAFTPNGDGQNETFHPVGLFIKSYNMLIYNKWGELVFEGQIWDGQAKNGTAPSGTYVCYIEAEDFTGEKFIKKGTVILIR
jgi:gliding motility-associated-like protein